MGAPLDNDWGTPSVNDAAAAVADGPAPASARVPASRRWSNPQLAEPFLDLPHDLVGRAALGVDDGGLGAGVLDAHEVVVLAADDDGLDLVEVLVVKAFDRETLVPEIADKINKS